MENLSENSSKNLSEIPSENPDGTPHGDEAPKASSSAKEFFHRINANPKEKQAILVPIIDRIATDRHYTRRRALDALVILVNEFLIPHIRWHKPARIYASAYADVRIRPHVYMSL